MTGNDGTSARPSPQALPLNERGGDDCRCVADGVYGKNTTYAVLMYQRAANRTGLVSLRETGVADGDTLENLGLLRDTGAATAVADGTGGGVKRRIRNRARTRLVHRRERLFVRSRNGPTP